MLLSDIITFGNIGIDEFYVYVILFLLFCLLIYYFIRPLSTWAIRRKMNRLLTYMIVSLMMLIFVLIMSHYVVSFKLERALKVGLQVSSLFGVFLIIMQPILRLIQKPVK